MSNVAQENAPLLNAIGLKKYYPVKKGMFAKTQQVKALDGVSFSYLTQFRFHTSTKLSRIRTAWI